MTMKKNILLWASMLSLSTHINATELSPVSNHSEKPDLQFSYLMTNIKAQASNTFMSTEPINLTFRLKAKPDEIGQLGRLYLVAKYQDKWYQKTAEGHWKIWDKTPTSLLPYQTKILEKEQKLLALKQETLPEGEFLVYAGYQTDASQPIFYHQTPASILVFNQDQAALHLVDNKELLTSYFAHGMARNGGFIRESDFSAATSTAADSTLVSQTNLQEIGVDEADRIKTDGQQLYVLESCKADAPKQCISSYDIQASPAKNSLLQKIEVGESLARNAGLYLANIDDKKQLIYHSDSSNGGMFNFWRYPYFWQNINTQIKIVDISQPDQMQTGIHITMDTSILSTRLIDGVLYVVTRKNPYFSLPNVGEIDAVEETTASDFSPTVPDDQTLESLLPTISFNNGEDPVPVVQAKDCYIPAQVSGKPVDNTIITITAIPLDNPQAHYSTCIAGSVDTFYMSTKALYLATSRYPSVMIGNELEFQPEEVEMTTEIHKFALEKGQLDYRGSGSVQGHLGWNADKQAFRMGEYKGVLRVATSHGNAWGSGERSTTQVSVLREMANTKQLEVISTLDNLGKPGERLFAARFIQDRGYLVTFKQTDPLYVLDFSTPEEPRILGELEINGYSDYLHPVGEHYLLGIGKDAVPNVNPDRGAWYQGVKLSLFDVSSADNLREVDSLVLGHRGTESAVLYDHHALAWLPSQDEENATLAIPLQLNQEKNHTSQDYSEPSAYYGWTHTGLYTLNINTGDNPAITLEGKLVTDTPPDVCHELGNYCSFAGQQTWNDRALIQDESIHYIHNNKVYSSEITDLE